MALSAFLFSLIRIFASTFCLPYSEIRNIKVFIDINVYVLNCFYKTVALKMYYLLGFFKVGFVKVLMSVSVTMSQDFVIV